MKNLLAVTVLSTLLLFAACMFITLFNLKTFERHQLNDIKHLVQRQQKNISYRLNLITQELRLTSENPLIIAALVNKHGNRFYRKKAEQFLYNLKNTLRLLTAYILNQNGTCIISTDPRFLKKNYSFRPYFKNALSKGMGAYVAKGVTSNMLGLYLAERIEVPDSKTRFVIVFKIDPLGLLEFIPEDPENNFMTLLATKNGVLFSRKGTLYTLSTLEKDVLASIKSEHQFDSTSFTNLGFPKDTFRELLNLGRLKRRINRKLYYLSYLPLVPGELGIVNIVSEDYKTPLLKRFEKGIILMDGLFLIAILPLLLLAFSLKRQHDALKRHEQSLEEYKYRIKLLDTAIEQTANSIVITDKDGTIEYVNPAFTKVTGYSAEEAIGQNPKILNAGVLDKSFYEEMWATLQSKQVWSGRFCNRKKDGTIYWEDAIISPVLDEEGNIVHFIAIKYDITRLVQLEDELKQRVNELETIMDSVAASIFLVKNRRLIKVNRQFSDLIGLPPEELIGKETKFLFDSQEEFEEFAQTWYPRLQNGETIHFEKVKQIANGEIRWFHVTATAARKGTTMEEMEIVWLAHDITEIKNLQSRLEEAKEKAEAANKAKSDFLASVSHEIRTPLNGIIGMLNLLKTTRLNEKQRYFVRSAENSAEILLFLINDILDFSKIEAGKLHLEELDFRLDTLIDKTISSLDVLARQKGIELKKEGEKIQGICLKGDPYRLRQILTNLIGNAIKFTDKGEVRVKVEVEGEAPDKITLLFSVKDTGIGIPKDKQKLLFKKFSQADSSITRRFGGTGLGLAICKNLVELMGGEIGVESEEGKGSTFWFRLTLKKGNEDAEGCKGSHDEEGFSEERLQRLSPQFKGKKVLVVDDNLINQQILISILTKLGLDVHAVSSGKEAIDALSSIPYDLVFMDLQMPEMDGIEATKRIRGRVEEVLDPDVPIVALTAHHLDEEYELYSKAGFSDSLTKPIMQDRLLQCLKRWLAPSTKESKQAPASLEKDGHSSSSEGELPHFDEEELLARAMDDPKIMKKVIEVYLVSAPKTLRDLEKAISNGDKEAIKFSAHSLKGASANIGAKRLAALAERMEDLATQPGVTDDLFKDLFSELIEEFSQVEGIFKKMLAQ